MDNILVIVGRFNPPTKGHYAMFSAARKFILENKDLNLDPSIYVVVINGKETSKNKQINPLSPEDRVMFMRASGHANGVKFGTAENVFAAFDMLEKHNNKKIKVIVNGTDRAQNYIDILDKYFPLDNNEKHIELKLKREEYEVQHLLDYFDEGLPTNVISASLARAAVKRDEFDKFQQIVGLEHNRDLAQKLFDKVKAVL